MSAHPVASNEDPATAAHPPRRSPLSRVTGRVAVVRRYGIPFFAQFAKAGETSATVFVRRGGTALVGKYFLDSEQARQELEAERRSAELFRNRPWRMPVERWGRRSMFVRRLPEDARLDVRAQSMSPEERLAAAVWALQVLVDIYLDGYLHGDLQPHNVWHLDGRLVVTDWSTFAARTPGLPFFQSADVTGTDPAYRRRFDPAFDPDDDWSFQYTVGVTLEQATASLREKLEAAPSGSARAGRRLAALDGRRT